MTSAVAMQTKQRPWWATLIMGIAAVIVGGILLWAPAKTKVEVYSLLVWFVAFYLLIEGVMDFVYMFVDHTAWGWKLFMGIINILAGLTIMVYPVASAAVLPKIMVLVLGIWALMDGIILLIMAFQGGGWGAGILGALAIILGLALIVNYTAPGMGLAFLWAAAVSAFVGGFLMIFMAFRQRSA